MRSHPLDAHGPHELSGFELEQLCCIAVGFYYLVGYTTDSWLGIGDKARYDAIRPRLTLPQLIQFLGDRPEFIGEWLRASTEARFRTDWRLERDGDVFVVRRQSGSDATRYSDGANATAEFIVLLIDEANAAT